MTATAVMSASRDGLPEASEAALTPRVVIANGLNRFHLAVAASELQRRGALAGFVTGAYPGRRSRLIGSVLNRSGSTRARRFLDRDENIESSRVEALWIPELLGQLGSAARSRGWKSPAERLDAAALRTFGLRARRAVRRHSDAEIYHYRSGFGLESTYEARRRGMFALCDHSIAHPGVLESLVESKGELGTPRLPRSRVLRSLSADLDASDSVLVNSTFVRETFIHCGHDPGRIHVLYLGVDDRFLQSIPATPRRNASGVLRLGFAGAFEERKGVAVLVEALSMVTAPWRLELAGPISGVMARKYASFLTDDRVRHRGNLSRSELARWLVDLDAFVFPSFAEGSARVVFEALACGRFVITTPNAGSIVDDGVHGRLVPPGDAVSLANALEETAERLDDLEAIGAANAALVRRAYRQSHYSEGLVRLYRRLLTGTEVVR